MSRRFGFVPRQDPPSGRPGRREQFRGTYAREGGHQVPVGPHQQHGVGRRPRIALRDQQLRR
ncbi:hypothetical protein I3W98_06910 [Streptomyces cavourensis]|nr:hypothetical protein [Streptomyces cavourensis]